MKEKVEYMPDFKTTASKYFRVKPYSHTPILLFHHHSLLSFSIPIFLSSLSLSNHAAALNLPLLSHIPVCLLYSTLPFAGKNSPSRSIEQIPSSRTLHAKCLASFQHRIKPTNHIKKLQDISLSCRCTISIAMKRDIYSLGQSTCLYTGGRCAGGKEVGGLDARDGD